MRKNGFTLIELLAVIVILAIIALIATPIILGIINDARKESNERSAELYASAVRNAIASYQLTHPNAPESFEDLDIEHDGNVVCETEELYADGSFYITDCTVNGTKVEYTYGEQQVTQVYKPDFYSWSTGNIGENLPNDATRDVAELDTKDNPFYLGLDVNSDNIITAAYTCFTITGIEYCLKSNYENAYETNKNVLEEAFGASACSFDEIYSEYDEFISKCDTVGLAASAVSAGHVAVDGGSVACYVDSGGFFACN